jgi:myo-inositol-1(or 4)-monophosphatase
MVAATAVAAVEGTATVRDSMPENDPKALLQRVDNALTAASAIFAGFDRQTIAELQKTGGDPVTEADLAIDRALKQELQGEGEGWLSEETVDDSHRLDTGLVWVVDPLDGTREFIDGLPEFCTSIAAVVDGIPVAGGILNPAAAIKILGAVGLGVTCNGDPVEAGDPTPLREMKVLASRSEVKRGQWKVVEDSGIEVKPMGSVAYKMARVAAGLDQATWTPVPKHEWDVAGGAALIRAIGGTTVGLDGEELVFNRENPWLEGAIAVPPGFEDQLDAVFALIRKQQTR